MHSLRNNEHGYWYEENEEAIQRYKTVKSSQRY